MRTPALYAHTITRGRWKMYAHIKILVRQLMRLEAREIERLLITFPPRHGKSETSSRWFPVYYLCKNPADTIMFASYEARYAARWSRAVRDTFRDNPEQFRIRLDDNVSAAQEWKIGRHGGGMVSAGVGGPFTGRGAPLLIVDDPVKNQQQAMSQTFRDSTWDWFNSTAYTRLEPDARGRPAVAVLIMTRWHEDDLAGRLIQQMEVGGERWEVVNFPAICEDDTLDTEIELGRSLGDALWPEQFPIERLEVIKDQIGPYWWVSLYQQHPAPLGGGIFSLDSWKFYDMASAPPFTRVIQSWDTAFKTGTENDYSVCMTLGEAENNIYLLDVWRGRVEFMGLQTVARALAQKWGASAITIEDAASGQSLLQVLRSNSPLPVIGVRPDGDKTTRAYAVQGWVTSGRVMLPHNAPWLADFLEETSIFPNGAHDDQVDAFVYGLKYLTTKSGVGIYL
jgi:predicted phage terminase large subunit-like protein